MNKNVSLAIEKAVSNLERIEKSNLKELNNKTEISYSKNLNGLDVKFSSNYSLMSKIPDYGANLEVSGTF